MSISVIDIIVRPILYYLPFNPPFYTILGSPPKVQKGLERICLSSQNVVT